MRAGKSKNKEEMMWKAERGFKGRITVEPVLVAFLLGMEGVPKHGDIDTENRIRSFSNDNFITRQIVF